MPDAHLAAAVLCAAANAIASSLPAVRACGPALPIALAGLLERLAGRYRAICSAPNSPTRRSLVR